MVPTNYILRKTVSRADFDKFDASSRGMGCLIRRTTQRLSDHYYFSILEYNNVQYIKDANFACNWMFQKTLCVLMRYGTIYNMKNHEINCTAHDC